jgi:hypothetical protein
MEDREEILSLTRIKNAKNPSLFKEKKRQELLDGRILRIEGQATWRNWCKLLKGNVSF